jgi:RNA polymerase sigma-70 factor (ECF subfamily)
MTAKETQLAELFKRDELEAFRQMFLLYYKPMCVAAKLYTAEPEDAEDIVQQVFMKFWEERHFSKITTSFKSFLIASVRNASLNHLKKQSTHQQKQQILRMDSHVEEAIDFLLREEELMIFENAYAQLPPQSRIVLEQVYFLNQPYKTAAKNLNLSINTVKSHLQNALRILKNSNILNNYFFDK